ncbi:MAG TPA: BON domain-containing protein [Bryobacteraceae bacterium]|nr:BON domain-containing protein [Bryobacteraceae bacterium]
MIKLLCIALAFSLSVAPLVAQKHVPDGEVIDQVRVKLANDPDVGGMNISVDSKDGAVTLAGKVKTEKQRAKAEKLTKKVKGVVSVNNQLVISPN